MYDMMKIEGLNSFSFSLTAFLFYALRELICYQATFICLSVARKFAK